MSAEFFAWCIAAGIVIGLIFIGLRATGNWRFDASASHRLDALDAEMTKMRRENEELRHDKAGLHAAVEAISRELGDVAQRVKLLENELAAVAAERDELRRTNHQLQTVNTALTEQLTGGKGSSGTAPGNLRGILSKRLSEDELRALASDIGADWESLVGASKDGKILSLLEWGEQRGQIADLVAWLRKTRPDIRGLA